ncbi:hypothetical protein HSRCO_0670 [Halanaeroarchaeum sp. HSR-CO]|uniref:hypothetical protein n=1 Tax=Halanaeroarchaeum sp. HSR-CO TaxID=2866382 RepID=UPI00217E92F3|nr:hypothetical protein [Halanaeroarchaeum sp. HSR-CO]UWG46965.1 hypothetical protein HSRCO_0670 [Halanaeroarchaeum sp. HSR-CO]
MTDEPAAVLLTWFDTNRRGTVDDVLRDRECDRETALAGLETLVDLDLVAAEPRRGTYRLTGRGRHVASRLESADGDGVREVAADVGPRGSVVDATAGP